MLLLYVLLAVGLYLLLVFMTSSKPCPSTTVGLDDTKATASVSPSSYPTHWGDPPAIQTKDLVQLPSPFHGYGSSTLKAWILDCQRWDIHLAQVKEQFHRAICARRDDSDARRTILCWDNLPSTLTVDTIHSMFVHHYVPAILTHVVRVSVDSATTTEYNEHRVRLVYDPRTRRVVHRVIKCG